MFQNLKVRIALILGLAAICIAALFYQKQAQGDIVTLGLDLKGGTYLALEVDESRSKLTPEQRVDAIDRALKVVRIRVEGLGLSEPIVQKAGDDRIEVRGTEKTLGVHLVDLLGARRTRCKPRVLRDDLDAANGRTCRGVLQGGPNQGTSASAE